MLATLAHRIALTGDRNTGKVDGRASNSGRNPLQLWTNHRGSYVKYRDVSGDVTQYCVLESRRKLGEAPYVLVFAEDDAGVLKEVGEVEKLVLHPTMLIEDGDLDANVPVAPSIAERLAAALAKLCSQTATTFSREAAEPASK